MPVLDDQTDNYYSLYSLSSICVDLGNDLFNSYRDEEYDRGKRKKIRSCKGSFGGPNPFQELATKKAHFKKGKMDRSRTGNQPLRI